LCLVSIKNCLEIKNYKFNRNYRIKNFLMSYFHLPVLLKETVEIINPQKNENLVDGTVGGGGHAKAILEKTKPKGKLLGMDLDPEALRATKYNLSRFENRIILKRENFADFSRAVKKYDFRPINIVLLDLGISSYQLDEEVLGISFLKNQPLDMRIGGKLSSYDNRVTAAEILNNWQEEKIKQIIKEYGEERYAKAIARNIVASRKVKKIELTRQLVEIIEKSVPASYKSRRQRIHFATRTFQALRIAVNKELDNLKNALPQILKELSPSGRMAVISFHSLEDRIVKQFFVKESKDCICGSEVPVCVCHHKKQLKILTKKPITPSEEEIERNPRARSGKLRVAIKL